MAQAAPRPGAWPVGRRSRATAGPWCAADPHWGPEHWGPQCWGPQCWGLRHGERRRRAPRHRERGRRAPRHRERGYPGDREHWKHWARDGERMAGPRGGRPRAPAVPASRGPPRWAAALSAADRPQRNQSQPGPPQRDDLQRDQPQQDEPQQGRPERDRLPRGRPERDQLPRGRPERGPSALGPGWRASVPGRSHPNPSARARASAGAPRPARLVSSLGQSSPARTLRSRGARRERRVPGGPVWSRPGPARTVLSGLSRLPRPRRPVRERSRRAATRAGRPAPTAAADPAVLGGTARSAAPDRGPGRFPAAALGPPEGHGHAGRARWRPERRAPRPPRHRPGRGATPGRRPVSHSSQTMARGGTTCAVRQCSEAEKQAAQAAACFPARAAL